MERREFLHGFGGLGLGLKGSGFGGTVQGSGFGRYITCSLSTHPD